MPANFVLYGATGYTGRLIIEEALKQGLRPLLAGRNALKLEALAAEFQLPMATVSLTDAEALDDLLKPYAVVLHAAGPFEVTAAPMWEACMRTQTHYLDITGEISVFEAAKKLHQAAQSAGIQLMPGVGFDVVPTDCLASRLHRQFPQAVKLELGFVGLGGGLSHGTATTMVRHLGEGGAYRKNGHIVPSSLGAFRTKIEANGYQFTLGSIPWGDVSTAFATTGIPTIITYTGIKPGALVLLKAQRLFNPLLRTAWIRNWLQRKIEKRPAGPDREALEMGRTLVWGRVTDANGNQHTAQHWVENGYRVTARSAIRLVQSVLDQQVTPGFQTPAKQYGDTLLDWLEVAPPKRTTS